ncbi:hypothetical protein [Aquabacterium sp. OR-4]|uniref:hypothetical protein n=1 Tax=Aquabacterium sp. OR-4 TaxID=2978127 RepID=UPI0021B41D81|nr:hypothetical protein [Aquabacterium sp. OR-4]MDT7834954.1 hypothetical protein [Aquabacterium sp. OR-4]
MPAAYPSTLPGVLRSKRRRQAPPWALLGSRRGPAYMLNTGTVPPVFFEVEWIFTAEQALLFRLWFEAIIGRGALPFTMALRTEFGLLDHVCQLLPDSLLPASEDGGTWRYSATLMTAAQIIPAEGLALATGLTTDYPAALPGVLQAGKRREREASFAVPQPDAGASQAEATGADRPVVWSVQWVCTQEQAQLLMAWFVVTLERGRLSFRMPIRTEFGLLWHACRFLPDGLMSATQEGEVWRYSASMQARSESIPPDMLEAAPLLLGLDDWASWGSVLDVVITATLPEA